MRDALLITERRKKNAPERKYLSNTPVHSSLQRSVKATRSLHRTVNNLPCSHTLVLLKQSTLWFVVASWTILSSGQILPS
ncbi:hypothetical protein VIGAN_10036300 [Vigna angularis var. angularis]|uniref:Uncharacterized protein n=1 Tax=Vigna angularis var. angularis TaxID=157739 RepID=A0A0S3T201_PHAAN|nr:hypothetical protein VIGAN_10036300 [Vigna angularis var. angularis]